MLSMSFVSPKAQAYEIEFFLYKHFSLPLIG